ncbi:hypothetical protein MBLNU13_g03089t2 [Cladosporium sp. NU13]
MEVIGAVSSVIALVEATSKLAKGLTHLAQRWHNAPEEINALSLATQQLCVKFAYVQQTVTDSPTILVDDVPRLGLTQLVSKAQSVTAELSTLHDRLESYDAIFQKARWAVKDAKTAKTALDKVKDIEEGLSMWISFISLKGHSLTLKHFRETQQLLTVGFTEMKQMFSTITTNAPLPASPLLLSKSEPTPLPSCSAASTSLSTARNHPTTAVRRVAKGFVWQASSAWKSWGLTGTVIKSTKGASIDYDVAISLQLPMAWWFGSHILKGEMARVLDYSHPFLLACQSNDVAVVREMLRNGEGRPTDEDPEGDGPLWYAVCHDSIEVLAELLDNGANIDTNTIGTRTTLLAMAAKLRHLEMLREYVVLDPQSTWQTVTVLHVVAASGDGPDVDALISRGHDVESKTDENLTPIACAVRFGNASTYLALLAHGAELKYSLYSVEIMLHEAVALQAQMPDSSYFLLPKMADYESIIKHIVQHGSPNINIAIRVQPGDDNYPPRFHGHSTTPRQLAEAFGPKTEAWFLTLLRESGQPHYFTKKDKRRLRTLRFAGYAPQGYVLSDGENFSEDDETDQSDDQSKDQSDMNDGEGDASSTQDEPSDVEEEEQFWDAEQGL